MIKIFRQSKVMRSRGYALEYVSNKKEEGKEEEGRRGRAQGQIKQWRQTLAKY